MGSGAIGIVDSDARADKKTLARFEQVRDFGLGSICFGTWGGGNRFPRSDTLPPFLRPSRQPKS